MRCFETFTDVIFMKGLFLIVLCFNLCSATAQIRTNVMWTQQSSLPAGDVIYYDEAKPLVWSNFQGNPILSGNVAAETMSGFGYTAAMKSKNGKGEINVSIYCYFSKPKSWVKPDRKTAYILEHEQRHFDISFIAANMFAHKVKEAKLTTANLNSVLPALYRECCAVIDKMQDDYDGETKNGQVKEMQAKWNKSLQEKIGTY